ncbi:hypothetical protein KDD17_06710 [Sulfitobacter albidus]|uniref:Uncharacterized protein n=1 Tax=Sulfitobacter albidus TaxID=2829501 RepID=A0A975JFS5_9RHOB|nr:hypothetical protein [Sulfitobacter albidus]QUJ77648.1 hypothetical protein KDD17_06710 [Sulfitobacter albidus]
MSVAILDPLTREGVAYTSAQGIRADTSSRGVDLAGTQITATYADGTVETLTWVAFDPYTFGGVTGADIDMSFGFSAHALSTTKLLTTLTFDLLAASSVFDITTTMEDDTDGINTPTSKNGFPFELIEMDEALTGSVGVTYSNIVSLGDAPAQGDLFTSMTIDFSALSTGGLLGDVTWNSDIDTLALAGDLTPLPPPPTRTTVEDTADAFVWTRYTDTIDADGVRLQRDMLYDDGRTLEILFQDGVKTRATLTDAAEVFGWTRYVDAFGPDGAQLTREVLFDNGRRDDVSYTDGLRSVQVSTDVADAFDWNTVSSTYAADGQRTGQTIAYDDGRRVEKLFENGSRTQTTLTDTADNFAWDSVVSTFAPGGARTSQTIAYDDGRVLEKLFENGSKTQATLTDGGDLFGWHMYVDTFAPDGSLLTREITYDDDSVVFTSFVDDPGLI